MNLSVSYHLVRLVLSVFLTAIAFVPNLFGARISYSFEGTLSPPLFGSSKLFGIDVPGSQPIVGTFSYEITTGTLGSSGEKSFPQAIENGLTINISDKIKLTTNQYAVSVWDDFQRQSPIQFVDVFQVSFIRGLVATDPALYVNGILWTKQAFINMEINWPASTFTGPEEPTLTLDRPMLPWPDDFSPIAAIASGSTAPRTFAITSITVAPMPEPNAAQIATGVALAALGCRRKKLIYLDM